MPASTTVIDGIEYTGLQIAQAVRACRSLVTSFEMGDDKNGGNGMDWSWFDDPVTLARSAMTPEDLQKSIEAARANNEFESPEDITSWVKRKPEEVVSILWDTNGDLIEVREIKEKSTYPCIPDYTTPKLLVVHDWERDESLSDDQNRQAAAEAYDKFRAS